MRYLKIVIIICLANVLGMATIINIFNGKVEDKPIQMVGVISKIDTSDHKEGSVIYYEDHQEGVEAWIDGQESWVRVLNSTGKDIKSGQYCCVTSINNFRDILVINKICSSNKLAICGKTRGFIKADDSGYLILD